MNLVFDGEDSDSHSFVAHYGDGYDIHGCTYRKCSNGVIVYLGYNDGCTQGGGG